MKTVTWDSKLVDFLANYNTVIVEKADIDLFINKMWTVGLDARRLKTQSEIHGDLLVGYDNSKGFTFWNYPNQYNPDGTLRKAIEESTKWYGIEPLKLEEIL